MEELAKDLAEMELLESQTQRQRVKNILSVEINKLQNEIAKLQSDHATRSPSQTNASRRYQVKLNNYAWDQSSMYVKFYVTLPNVQTVPAENITCKFTEKSLELEVKDLDNRDHTFAVNNLLYPIKPNESNWKVKSDMVVISAAKLAENNWAFVTETEKRSSDAKKPALPDYDKKAEDPSEGLMSLMKKMYAEGDDDMKRTIAKAFHESQTKPRPY